MATSLAQEPTISLYDRWHSGERKMQDLLQVREAVQNNSSYFRPFLTVQMQEFVPGLNYFFIGTLDHQGRPWVSILTGDKGFLHASDDRTLEVKTQLTTSGTAGRDDAQGRGDPIFSNLVEGETIRDGKRKWGGVALDFTNRRRNKVNGTLYPGNVLVADKATGELHVRLTVEQTIGKRFFLPSDLFHASHQCLSRLDRELNTLFVLIGTGNCPKYITIREMVPRPEQDESSTHVTPAPTRFGEKEEQAPSMLSEEAKAVIRQADCFFISSRFIDDDLPDQTSGMDCNHRGGNPGFVRIEGNQLALPDYSGNRVSLSLPVLLTRACDRCP